MRSLLTPSDYTSSEAFDREQDRLFRRLWIFAGFASVLSAPDAFITHLVAGVPIVIQNTSEGLRAFVNRCAHRQSPVQSEDFGQRRLACPYHGWVYDERGRVRSIQGLATNYGFDAPTVASLGLDPIALRCVGGLVFVHLDPSPPPLEDQFHAAYLDTLEAMSGHAGIDAMFAKFTGEFNWKLNFENVVDWNHVAFVHAASFAKLTSASQRSLGGAVAAVAPPVPDDGIGDDLRDLSFESRGAFDWTPWPWHDLVERCAGAKEYVNLFIYPNVNYVIMAGAVHLVQQFCPVGAGRTEVRLTMVLGKRRKRLPAASAILWGHMKSEKQVINEDIAILEGVQRGLTTGAPRAFHGAYENRLRQIAKVYRRWVDSP